MPRSPQLMLLRLNQPTLLASGWASVGKLSIAFGTAITARRSAITGAPVIGFNSEVMPAHLTPMISAGKLRAMASDNAHPTIARMAEGLVDAVQAAATATKNKRTRATSRRRTVGAFGSSIL